MPVTETQQNAAAARIDTDDPVRKAACIRDAVDDDRRPGDRPAGADGPEHVPLAAETP